MGASSVISCRLVKRMIRADWVFSPGAPDEVFIQVAGSDFAAGDGTSITLHIQDQHDIDMVGASRKICLPFLLSSSSTTLVLVFV